MARIAGVDLPREKRIAVGLTYIYGMGHARAAEALAATEVDPDTRVRDLQDDDIVKLRSHIESAYRVEGDLRREIANNIKRKIETGSYQGMRHRLGLPVRGQRTHTNARSRKGPRKTVGGIRKPTRKG